MWRSPDTKKTNQIEHVVIEKIKKIITHIRTYRSADIVSDHFLIETKMIQSIPEERNKQKITKSTIINPET